MIVKELQGKKPKMTDESLLTSTPGGSTPAIPGIPPPRRGKGTRDGHNHYLYMCVYVS